MANTTNEEDKELVKTWIRRSEIGDLIELWETLTNEINCPSVIWGMDFFLEEYLPECLSAKTVDVVDLARIVTADDACVKHFDINDDSVYINSFGLWESVNEYGIADLVIDLIDDYDMATYSDTLKEKISELKEEEEEEEEEEEDINQAKKTNEDLKND